MGLMRGLMNEIKYSKILSIKVSFRVPASMQVFHLTFSHYACTTDNDNNDEQGG